MTTTDELRARAQAFLALAADRNLTEAPWEAHFTSHGDPSICVPQKWKTHRIAELSTWPEDYGKANNLFIAASRNDSPALIRALLDALEAAERIATTVEHQRAAVAETELAVWRARYLPGGLEVEPWYLTLARRTSDAETRAEAAEAEAQVLREALATIVQRHESKPDDGQRHEAYEIARAALSAVAPGPAPTDAGKEAL